MIIDPRHFGNPESNHALDKVLREVGKWRIPADPMRLLQVVRGAATVEGLSEPLEVRVAGGCAIASDASGIVDCNLGNYEQMRKTIAGSLTMES